MLDRPGLAVTAPHGERGARREEPAGAWLTRHRGEEELALSGRASASGAAATTTSAAACSTATTAATRTAGAVAARPAALAHAILCRGKPGEIAPELAAVADLLLRRAGLVERGQHGLHELGHDAVRRQQDLLHVVARPGRPARDLALPAAIDLVAGDLQVGLEGGIDRGLEQRLEALADDTVLGVEGTALVHQRDDVALGLAERIRRRLRAFLDHRDGAEEDALHVLQRGGRVRLAHLDDAGDAREMAEIVGAGAADARHRLRPERTLARARVEVHRATGLLDDREVRRLVAEQEGPRRVRIAADLRLVQELLPGLVVARPERGAERRHHIGRDLRRDLLHRVRQRPDALVPRLGTERARHLCAVRDPGRHARQVLGAEWRVQPAGPALDVVDREHLRQRGAKEREIGLLLGARLVRWPP